MNPSVLLMARAPRAGECKRRLEAILTPQGCARLQAVLLERAAAWGQTVADGKLHAAYAPADAGAELERLLGGRAQLFAQEGDSVGECLAAAAARAGGDGPLLIVYPDLPTLGPAHAQAALDDLRAGIDVSVGPATGGGFYLLALRSPAPELFAAAQTPRDGVGVVGGVLAAVQQRGLRVGLMRSERDLHTPDDVRALLADPLTPADVRAALKPPETAAAMRDPMAE